MSQKKIDRKKTAFEIVEEKGYKAGRAGLPFINPYLESRYGFGKGFYNAWRRGYERGKANGTDENTLGNT